MAICRCAEHAPLNQNKHTYTHLIEPIGYPKTAAICGHIIDDKSDIRCEEIGMVYLTSFELHNFQQGHRVFTLATSTIRVKVKDKAPMKYI